MIRDRNPPVIGTDPHSLSHALARTLTHVTRDMQHHTTHRISSAQSCTPHHTADETTTATRNARCLVLQCIPRPLQQRNCNSNGPQSMHRYSGRQHALLKGLPTRDRQWLARCCCNPNGLTVRGSLKLVRRSWWLIALDIL